MPEAAGAKRNTGMAKGYLFLILFAFFVAWQTPFVTILQNHGVPAIGTVTMTFVVAAVLINLIAFAMFGMDKKRAKKGQ